MKPIANRLLQRQIRKYLSGADLQSLDAFLQAVGNSYDHYERDRELLERSMDLSSKELLESNKLIRSEAEKLRAAEAIVRENEQMLKSINANINDAIYRSTPDKGLIYVNRAFADLFGFDSLAEALEATSKQLYRFPEQRLALSEQIMKHGFLKGEEVLFSRRDGSTFWGLISSILIKDSSGMFYYDGAIVDITVRKRNEEVLKQTNKELKKTNAELDRFVYSASHDLRAPLTSLLGLLNLVELETSDPAILEYASLMERSIKKMDSFIHDIIDYSSNARLQPKWEQIDFDRLIENSMENLRYMPGADTIETKVHMDESHAFHSDPKRLNILFNNLISNSIKYHNFRQENPYIKISTSVSQDVAQISYEDNGIGIQEEHLGKIFDMFYRASDKSNGTGLGLYIVKETIDKLKGSIRVNSVAGRGTSFQITLPNQLR